MYTDLLKTDTSYLRYFTAKYRSGDSAFAGFVAITANRIISCELFASTDLTRASFFPLLTGYIHAAISNGAPPEMKIKNIVSFMDQLLRDETSQKHFIATHGKMYRNENKVIHIAVYGD